VNAQEHHQHNGRSAKRICSRGDSCVALEVRTEGKLGGQGVGGSGWYMEGPHGQVNTVAANLTGQVRAIAEVTTTVASGDRSKNIDVKGEILELKNTINMMVGTEGKLGGQAYVRGVVGTWKDLTDDVKTMAGNLTSQVHTIAKVTTAVANGDLSKKIQLDVKG